MAITKAKKESIIEELKEIFSKAVSMVFVNFHGLSVSDASELRKSLREKEIGYKVAKKTLIKKVADSSKKEGALPELEGEVALVYGDDPVMPAKKIADFVKNHKEQMKILGGIFEGKYQNALAMNELASIPEEPVLRGMFVNVINSPIQGLVVALGELAKKKEN